MVGITLIGDEFKNLPPEEKERIIKDRQIRSHYSIDIRPGDLVRYRFAGVEFIGLVEDIDERLSPGYGDLPGVKKKYAKVIWSSKAPENSADGTIYNSISNMREKKEEETSWYELNRLCWSVANR